MPNYTRQLQSIEYTYSTQKTGEEKSRPRFCSPGNFVGSIWLDSLLRAQSDKWVRAHLEALPSLWRLRKEHVHAHVAGLDSSGKNHDSTKLPKASICLQDILQECTVRGGRRRKSNVKGKRHVDCHSSVTTGTTKRMKAEHAKHQPHSHAGILTSDYAETNFILAKQPLGLAECSASTAGRSPSSSHPVGFVIHSICFGLIWCPQRHASILDPWGSGRPWKEPTLVAATWPRWLSHHIPSKTLSFTLPYHIHHGWASRRISHAILIILMHNRDSWTGNYPFAEPR